MDDTQPDKNLSYIEWKSWDADEFGTTTAKDSAVYSYELRRAGVKLTDHSSVLEVGFGNGTFAGWVRRKTTHYVGTESNPELVTRARHATPISKPIPQRLSWMPSPMGDYSTSLPCST